MYKGRAHLFPGHHNQSQGIHDSNLYSENALRSISSFTLVHSFLTLSKCSRYMIRCLFLHTISNRYTGWEFHHFTKFLYCTHLSDVSRNYPLTHEWFHTTLIAFWKKRRKRYVLFIAIGNAPSTMIVSNHRTNGHFSTVERFIKFSWANPSAVLIFFLFSPYLLANSVDGDRAQS